jgi:hypothetical protein
MVLVDLPAGQFRWRFPNRLSYGFLYRLRSRANLRSRSRSPVGGYSVSVKGEPVEENKESGIILDLTRCGQRLNNRAAILQSKIT